MLAERMGDDVWIFGYGSLMWRPEFPHLERCAGFIEGFARRFWQGSTDHRGVPEAPGRVVTLVPEARARCWGLAYRVAAAEREAVLAGLDHRERGGFERRAVDVRLDRSARVLAALTYVAGPGNPNYLGPAPLAAIAAQVRSSHGPSGANLEYVLRLAEALREIGGSEPELDELVAWLQTV